MFRATIMWLPFKFPSWLLVLMLLVSSMVTAVPVDPDYESGEHSTMPPTGYIGGPALDYDDEQPTTSITLSPTYDEITSSGMPADDDSAEADTEKPEVIGGVELEKLVTLNRERDKLMRLQTIQAAFATFINRDNLTTSVTSNAETPQTNLSMEIQQSDVMQALADANIHNFPANSSLKIQGFYPTCDTPKEMKDDTNSNYTMNLIFNISMPRGSKNWTVNVTNIKLRLFKQFVSCNLSESSNKTDTSCQPTSSEHYTKRSKNANSPSSSLENPSLTDNMVRVSVYVVRNLNTEKERQLLDSRMIPLHGEDWTVWNILHAVKNLRNPVGNFALIIEVKDKNNNLLPANRIFKQINCTGNETLALKKSIPGFLMKSFQSKNVKDDRDTYTVNRNGYPIADITTIEWPKRAKRKHGHRNIRHGAGENRYKITKKNFDDAIENMWKVQERMLLQRSLSTTTDILN